MYLTDGTLYKKPQETGKFKGKYFQTFIGIDFKRQIIRLKKFDEDEVGMKRLGLHHKKELQFNEILEIKSLDLDFYQAEQIESLEKLPFRSKFMVRSVKTEHFFFAQNDTERNIWLESFAKVLEYNKCGIDKFNLKSVVDIDSFVNHGKV